MNFNLPFPELYPVILETIHPPTKVYLVGGCVRDLLLGRSPQDIDLAFSADVKKVSRRIANVFEGAVYSLDDERQTMRVIVEIDGEKWKLDIALLRGGSLEGDLRTRDFTVNAMALEILSDKRYELIDLLNGQLDLKNKVIRSCNTTSLVDDPIRILRSVRLALALGFELDTEVKEQMVKAVYLVSQVSSERQRDELFKLLDLVHSINGFRLFRDLGIFEYLFPCFLQENMACLDKLEWQLADSEDKAVDTYIKTALIDERTVQALLKMAVLIGERPGGVDAVSEFYALSNREKVFLERIKSGLAFLCEFCEQKEMLEPIDIYRYYRIANEAGVGASLVEFSDMESRIRKSVLVQLMQAYFDEYDRYIAVKSLLDGNDLIRVFHLQPGPLFKELLESLKEAQVMGDVTSKAEAERYIEGQLN